MLVYISINTQRHLQRDVYLLGLKEMYKLYVESKLKLRHAESTPRLNETLRI